MKPTAVKGHVPASEMAEKRMIYVIGNEILSPIVESQVYRPMAIQAMREGAKGTVITVLPVGYFLRPELRRKLQLEIRRFLNQYGIHTRVVYGGISRLQCRFFEVAALKRCLRKCLAAGKQTRVIGRNSHAASLMLDAVSDLTCKPQTVFDCRGDEPFEVVGALGGGWDHQSWSTNVKAAYEDKLRQQRRACDADRIIVVSEVMAKMLHERHDAEREIMSIRPCAVDLGVFPKPDKQAARKLLGVDDRLVVSYLGSLAWYQLPDQGIRLFKLIKNHRPDALFLGITTEPDLLMEMLRKSGFSTDDYKVISVPSNEVAKILPAADMGLLLREPNPVNAVASPVKFAEYLACGLSVLVTDGIGDYSDIVRHEGLGGVVNIREDDDKLSQDLSRIVQRVEADPLTASRARKFAEENLSLSD